MPEVISLRAAGVVELLHLALLDIVDALELLELRLLANIGHLARVRRQEALLVHPRREDALVLRVVPVAVGRHRRVEVDVALDVELHDRVDFRPIDVELLRATRRRCDRQ